MKIFYGLSGRSRYTCIKVILVKRVPDLRNGALTAEEIIYIGQVGVRIVIPGWMGRLSVLESES